MDPLKPAHSYRGHWESDTVIVVDHQAVLIKDLDHMTAELTRFAFDDLNRKRAIQISTNRFVR